MTPYRYIALLAAALALFELGAQAGMFQERKKEGTDNMKPCTISDILGQLTAAELNELDQQAAEVVRAVESSGKAGALALKITLKKNGVNSTMVGIDLKTTIPRPAATGRVLFFDYDTNLHATGKLSQNPPSQEPLFESDRKPRLVEVAKK